MRSQSVAFILLAVLAVPLLAQTAPSDQTLPPGSLPADQMLQDMLNKPAVPAPAPTTRALSATLEPQGYVAAAPSRTLREGADIINRSGHLRKRADSPYPEFVFDNSPASGAQLNAMLVLPNLQLMSMEDSAAVTRRDLKFTVSAIVTEYKGANYILLEPSPEALDRQIPASALKGEQHSPASPDQMLDAMLRADANPAVRPATLAPPATDKTSGSSAVVPGAPANTVLREGSLIVDRVCRLTRSDDGRQAELTFDADGAALQDPPVIILPNLKLAAIETAAAGDIHDPHFSVSGIITEYRGRNYILLQKVVVMADAARQF